MNNVAASDGIFQYLGEEYAELFERLEQAGISDLLDDKDTFGRLVPCQSLAGGVLNVPEHRKTQFHFWV